MPIENQVVFRQNRRRFLQRGEIKIIHFFMGEKTYDIKNINPTFDRKGMLYLFNNGEEERLVLNKHLV